MIVIISENIVDFILDSLHTAKRTLDILPALPPGIKPVYISVLHAIYRIQRQDGCARVTDINKALGFLLPNTTKIVHEMAALNVVEKVLSPTDKRVVLIRPTQLGEEYIREYILRYHALLEREFSALDQESCRIMNETISKVNSAIQKVYQNNK